MTSPFHGHPLAADVAHVFRHTEPLWEPWRGARFFLTGGTGFFGCWLLETFTAIVDALDLRAEIVVLTRDPAAFARKVPRLAGHQAVRLHMGDVRDFIFPAGEFRGIIHAAAEVDPGGVRHVPREIFETGVAGTRRVLDFALAAGAERLLFTSSGAVYGRQPAEVTHLPETFTGAPDPTNPTAAAYGESKRAAEFLCAATSAEDPRLVCTIARAFAFVGPYLPLDGPYAIGNFLRDRLRGDPIRVAGDGTPLRSYLHAADLAIWLWTIFFRGAPGRAYNVGSEQALPIAEIAATVAESDGGSRADLCIANPAAPDTHASRYVPSTRRAQTELGLRERIALPDAIRRTLTFLRSSAPNPSI